MDTHEQYIVGLAEPLSSTQRAARLRELAAWGVDLSLSGVQLDKSPDECIDEWLAMRDFAEAAARARAEGRMYSYHPRRPISSRIDEQSE